MSVKSENGQVFQLSGPSKPTGEFWNFSDVKYINFENHGKTIYLKNIRQIAKPQITPKIEQIKEQNNIPKSINTIVNKSLEDDYLEEDMAVLKKDGSEYSVVGSMRTYPTKMEDYELFDKLDQEQIELAGSVIVYYPCYIDTNYDELYMESIDSIIAQEGYKLYAQFNPVHPQQTLSAFGMDSADELFFNFNLSKWKATIGKVMPTVKSIIFCEWDKTYWEVVQRDLEPPYKLWQKYRLQVYTKKYQPSRGDKQPTRRDINDYALNKTNIY